MNRLRRPLAVATLAAFFAGCHAIETAVSSGNGQTGAPQTALPYYLPKAVVRLTGEYVDVIGEDGKPTGEREFKVTMQALYSADLGNRLFAHITTNPMFDEESIVKTTGGLLNTTSALPADRTGDAIVTLARIGMSGLLHGTRLSASEKIMGSVPAESTARNAIKPFNHVFDPLSSGALADAEKTLQKSGFDLIFGDKEALERKMAEEDANPPKSDNLKGLVYRVPLPLTLWIRPSSGWKYTEGTGAAEYKGSVIVPDRKSFEMIPFRRVLFSKRETKVEWVDGMPVELSLKQPSPVIGGLSVPLKILDAAGEAIPSLIQIQNNAPTDRLNAEANRIDAEARLLESQRKLEALRAADE